jgi:hypothetical protein
MAIDRLLLKCSLKEVTLPRQGHVVDPDVMTPVLEHFFNADD